MKIFKFDLTEVMGRIDGTQPFYPSRYDFYVDLPIGSEILSIQRQEHSGRIVMWARVIPWNDVEPFHLVAIGTGQQDEGCGRYITTLQFLNGHYVLHFFEGFPQG